jgi:hypothetical protein
VKRSAHFKCNDPSRPFFLRNPGDGLNGPSFSRDNGLCGRVEIRGGNNRFFPGDLGAKLAYFLRRQTQHGSHFPDPRGNRFLHELPSFPYNAHRVTKRNAPGSDKGRKFPEAVSREQIGSYLRLLKHNSERGHACGKYRRLRVCRKGQSRRLAFKAKLRHVDSKGVACFLKSLARNRKLGAEISAHADILRTLTWKKKSYHGFNMFLIFRNGFRLGRLFEEIPPL